MLLSITFDGLNDFMNIDNTMAHVSALRPILAPVAVF